MGDISTLIEPFLLREIENYAEHCLIHLTDFEK